MLPKQAHLLVSAPGSVMLLGEHAVLRGAPALVSAVNYRIKVKYIPRADRKVILRSVLGEKQTELENIQIEAPFHFVLASIQTCLPMIQSGFELEIESEFSHQVGLGSSAAVTAATIGALHQHFLNKLDLASIWKQSQQAIRAVQGRGSGADAAASVYGGIVYFQQQFGMVEHFSTRIPYGLIYSGSKTPTGEVIKYVEEQFKHRRAELTMLDEAIAECTRQGLFALRQHNLDNLGKAFNQQQQCMVKLGVCDQTLQSVMDELVRYQFPGVKISGSGLGDCVIFLGDAPAKLQNDQRYIPIQTSLEGIVIE